MEGEQESLRSPSLAEGVPDRSVTVSGTQALSFERQAPKIRYRSSLTAFMCRLDVCWTLFFFLFLVAVAAITTAVTQTLISRTLLDTWHSIHFIRIYSISRRIGLSGQAITNMANAFQSLHLQHALKLDSESTISLLCAALARYDVYNLYRAFVLISMQDFAATGCFHGRKDTGSPDALDAFLPIPAMNNGTFLVDPTTYRLVRPLKMIVEWPEYARNTTANLINTFGNYTLFTKAGAYYNGTLDYIPPEEFWTNPPNVPHLILYTLPLGISAKGTVLQPGQHTSDFVQVRLDGSQLLINYDNIKSTDFAAVAFIEASLQDADPMVLSNNWGQPALDNTSLYSTTAYQNVSYLRASGISSPIMRAALKHVDLKALQQADHNRTVDFLYGGAPSTVTALHATLGNGLRVPLVFVSQELGKTGPYKRIMDICTGVTAAVIVCFTALFWWLAHTCFSLPLRRMTALLLASLATGRRAVFVRGGAGACGVQLTEVQQLAAAHNAMMRQLREVDAFVPVAVRELLRRGGVVAAAADSAAARLTCEVAPAPRGADSLCSQPATLVYVTVRRRDSSSNSSTGRHSVDGAAVSLLPTMPTSTAAVASPPTGGDGGRRGRGLLVAAVEKAAQAAEMVNSGPFATPAALAAFVAAVHALSERHGGVVQLLCPDACLLRFGACARRRLHARRCRTSACDGGSDGAAQDAVAALGFMLDLQRWVDAQGAAPPMPYVWSLADSGSFVCGHYRARGSEQTLTVALGRDVQRKLGHVPAALGVRVALTEETAVLVHPLGVRVLPVAAMRVGRPRLNADVVVLYEALPGAAAGDAAWLAYARCCVAGFECMARGDYAGALHAYRGVGEISDLEPGLLPHCLSREAAHSDAVGGAVSVQAERLMRECERLQRAGCSGAYLHVRHVPLGIDALLRDAPLACAAGARGGRGGGRASLPAAQGASGWGDAAVLHDGRDARQRRLVTLVADVVPVRCVVGDPPPCIADQHGMLWRLPAGVVTAAVARSRSASFTVLGSTGTLCTAVFFAFRDVPPVIAKAVRGAPDGPLSPALRSAVPVWDASSAQRAVLARLFAAHRAHQHPNLLRPVGYSLSVEGGVVGLWECCRGGCMRELVTRYTVLNPVVVVRCGLGVLSALSHLHSRGMVHGSLSLDTVVVGFDGACRLMHQTADPAAARALLVQPRTCYVSPAMAAGALPTAACDMFCYGLLSLEVVARRPPWIWAAVGDAGGATPQRTPEALAALMAEGGAAFSAAVVAGDVVPNTAVLEPGGAAGHYTELARETVRRCVAADLLQRPTAEEVREVNKTLLAEVGLMVEE